MSTELTMLDLTLGLLSALGLTLSVAWLIYARQPASAETSSPLGPVAEELVSRVTPPSLAEVLQGLRVAMQAPECWWSEGQGCRSSIYGITIEGFWKQSKILVGTPIDCKRGGALELVDVAEILPREELEIIWVEVEALLASVKHREAREQRERRALAVHCALARLASLAKPETGYEPAWKTQARALRRERCPQGAKENVHV